MSKTKLLSERMKFWKEIYTAIATKGHVYKRILRAVRRLERKA